MPFTKKKVLGGLLAAVGAAALTAAASAQYQPYQYGPPAYGYGAPPPQAPGNLQQDQYGMFNPRFNWRTNEDWFNAWFDQSVDWLQGMRGRNAPYGYAPYDQRAEQNRPYRFLGSTGEATNLMGSVLDVRPLQLEGRPQPHLVAQVRVNNERTLVADLGGVQRLQNEQVYLAPGQPLTLTGVMGRIDDRPVLVVTQLVTPDNRVVATRGPGPGVSPQYAPGYRRGQYMRQGYGYNQPGYYPPPQPYTYGQQQPYYNQPGYYQPQPYAYGTPGQAGNYVLRGRITDVNDVNNPNGQGKDRLLKVRTDSGQEVWVNAGRRGEAKAENLKKGQDVEVFGFSGTVDNKPGIIATGINNISNEAGFSQQQPYSSTFNHPGNTVFRGRITDVSDVDNPNGQGKDRLLRVRTDTGQEVWVNAGSRREAKTENLKKGQDVEVFGYSGTVNDRPGIIATGINNITNK